MQVGITGFGAYIPIFRMDKKLVGDMWEKWGGKGQKAVANWDEDSLTMAIEACLDSLRAEHSEPIEGVVFSSTTPPYYEKQSASFIRKVLDLSPNVFATDICNSLRGGTIGMRIAMDAVKSGLSGNYIVASSDLRLAPPNSALELQIGDGAAALMIGSKDPLAVINDHYSVSSEFIDSWRRDKDTYIQMWEDRFVMSAGYQPMMVESIKTFMSTLKVTASDYAFAVIGAPTLREMKTVAKKTGFTFGSQVSPLLFEEVGNTGTALSFMLLVEALEKAKPGDRILLASYGDGIDLFDITVTDNIASFPKGRGIQSHLDSKMTLPSYGSYLRFRNLLKWEFDRRLPDRTSLPVINRESSQIYSLHGSKCRNCGAIQYPIQRICPECQSKDDFEEINISRSKGNIFTFSMDERAMVPDLPNVLCIADLAEGGRYYSVMTDRIPASIKIGMQVEMTFRRIHEGLQLYNYFWKTRPVRANTSEG